MVVGLERRMSNSKGKKEKGDDKDKSKWVDMLEKKLMEAIEGQSEAVMKKIEDMEEKVRSEIEGVKLEVKKSIIRIGETEQKNMKLEKELIDNNKKLQECIVMIDCKMLELYLCFRGVPEEQGNI